jgi:hypothetical protein
LIERNKTVILQTMSSLEEGWRAMALIAARTCVFAILALATCRLGLAQEDRIRIRAPEKVEVTCALAGKVPGTLRFNDLRSPALDAQIVVTDLIQSLGIKTNVPLYIGPVDGIAAVNIDKYPALVYSPASARMLFEKTKKNRWAVIAVLTHELGHQFNPRATAEKGDATTRELEADFASGGMMRRLGASLDEALSAVRAGEGPGKPSDQPAKDLRIQRITDGYREAGPTKPPEAAFAPQGRKESGRSAAAQTAPHRVPCVHPLPCTHDIACQHQLPCRHRAACVHQAKGGFAHKYDSVHDYDLAHPVDPEHDHDSEHGYDLESAAVVEKVRPFTADVTSLFEGG